MFSLIEATYPSYLIVVETSLSLVITSSFLVTIVVALFTGYASVFVVFYYATTSFIYSISSCIFASVAVAPFRIFVSLIWSWSILTIDYFWEACSSSSGISNSSMFKSSNSFSAFLCYSTSSHSYYVFSKLPCRTQISPWMSRNAREDSCF